MNRHRSTNVLLIDIIKNSSDGEYKGSVIRATIAQLGTQHCCVAGCSAKLLDLPAPSQHVAQLKIAQMVNIWGYMSKEHNTVIIQYRSDNCFIVISIS